MTSFIKCGLKLLIHSQTSTIAPLKFGNGKVISSHTLLGMWLFIRVRIKLNHISKGAPGSPRRRRKRKRHQTISIYNTDLLSLCQGRSMKIPILMSQLIKFIPNRVRVKEPHNIFLALGYTCTSYYDSQSFLKSLILYICAITRVTKHPFMPPIGRTSYNNDLFRPHPTQHKTARASIY